MKKILFVDMDNVLVDFSSGVARLPRDIVQTYDGRLDEVPGIFALMDPLPGAVESFVELAGLFDTYIVSTSPWVKGHLGAPAYKRLILTHHKNLARGDFLIDDRTKNGADRFCGELVQFGTPEFPDWASVTGYLRQKAA